VESRSPGAILRHFGTGKPIRPCPTSAYASSRKAYAATMKQGMVSTAFYRLEDLLHAMKQDADVAPRSLRGKKYLKVSLLIIDEVGFQPMTRQEASLFFRLVSYRYQRGSTIITTNKAVQDWPEVLAGDEVMATAILDRLLHRCHVLAIKGRSYRLKELEKLLK
jgi:DNA replication protein DnaC